jgi:Zn-dependent protease with chaperone function
MIQIPLARDGDRSTKVIADANGDAQQGIDNAVSASESGAAGNISERTREQLFQEILAAFGESVPRVHKTMGYRLGVLLVGMVMLLLPAVYVGLICSVGFFVYWHATSSLELVKYNVWALIFFYAAPLFAGVVLILFLIKPLFARRIDAEQGVALDPAREPILFTFVTRITRAVEAPEPARIRVDCEVNASASFEGGIGGLLGGRLVLTIGLPLVAGLTSRELAGVLAHELGHFAQGAGMRISYLVRSINLWFMRMVYERDSMDAALAGYAEEAGRFAPIFWLTLLCLGVARGILWVLMTAGHMVGCFLLRQMEYDADRFEVRVAGSDDFAKTFRRMALLDTAARATFAEMGRWWATDSYPEDLPGLIVGNVEQLSDRVKRSVRKEMDKAKTGLFDTHPCFKDRLANARREAAFGIFHLDDPATVLVSDYPRLARRASQDFFRHVLGRRVSIRRRRYGR